MTKGQALQQMVKASKDARQSGDQQGVALADHLDQQINKIKSDPKHQDLNQVLGSQPQGQMGQAPQLNQAQLAQSPTNTYQQQIQQPVQTTQQPITQGVQQQQPQIQQTQNQFPSYGDMDVKKLIQQALSAGQSLNPNIGQTIGGMMSTIGGGKPYVSPAQEIAQKAAEANLSMSPYKAMLMQSQYNKNNSEGGLAGERQNLLSKGNQLFDNAMNSDQNNPNQPNMQMSGFSSTRGPSFKNLTEFGQEKGITAAIKPLEMQNAKVDSGLHALRVMDQNFDSKIGQFDVAKMNKGELDQNLANIIAGQGPSSDARVEGIRQSSLAGSIMDKVGYLIGKPVNVLTPDIAKLLHQTLIGQIKQSDMERQPYKQQLGISQFGNDPEQYFQRSPSYQYYYGQGEQSNQQPTNQQSNTPSIKPGQRLLRNKITGETRIV